MVLYLAPEGAAKCEIMKIHPYPNFMIGYTYQAVEMNLVNEEKDLGMWCTGDLKQSPHCKMEATKAMQILGLTIFQNYYIGYVYFSCTKCKTTFT